MILRVRKQPYFISSRRLRAGIVGLTRAKSDGIVASDEVVEERTGVMTLKLYPMARRAVFRHRACSIPEDIAEGVR